MSDERKIPNLRENKMRTMPLGKLLFNMALPLVLSMLVQALYNVVDSVYVAGYSQNAVTALSLAFPIQNIGNSHGKYFAVADRFFTGHPPERYPTGRYPDYRGTAHR